MFNFNFRLLGDRSDLTALVRFLRRQDISYPGYQDWVERAEFEIDAGYKRAVIALSDNQLVGDVIFQPHKGLPGVREIKNIRVHPDVRRRDFAHFMLRQAEVESSEDYQAIIVDARSEHQGMIGLLRFSGYVPLASVPLYDPNVKDVVMIKCFDRTTESGIIHKSRELILGRAL